MLCIRCQKRPAIIFIQRMDGGQMKQEGYCLHCARELHIKPVDDLMKQFGMSDQDLDNMESRMESMMEEMGDSNPLSMMMNMANGGEDADPDSMDEDLVPGSNATFPLGFTSSDKKEGVKKTDRKNGKKPPKRKFLDTYCENLTRKAREGRLTEADYHGGTFTVSSLGMFDLDDFVAIINPPESAILAVGKIAKTPVVVTDDEGEDQVVIKSMCALCLSYDHRIIDGAEAAKFLQKLKSYLQNPILLI